MSKKTSEVRCIKIEIDNNYYDNGMRIKIDFITYTYRDLNNKLCISYQM